jgi:hypothetical protein
MSNVNERVDALRNKLASKVQKFDRPIVGWRPDAEPTRKEGEKWFDIEGKAWTVKNGIKQSISKLQEAKTPWWCPKCDKSMSHRLDDKFYRLYSQCYDCTIKEHTQMRIDGTWEAFEKKMLRENEKSYLRDMISERKEYIRTFRTPQIHFENGGWEELAKIEHFAELFESLQRDIQACEDRLAVLETEEQTELETNNGQ